MNRFYQKLMLFYKRKGESRKQKAIKANDQSGIKSFALVIRFYSFLLSAFLKPFLLHAVPASG